MANWKDTIGPEDGLVAGDHFPVRRSRTEVPDGVTLDKAWLTCAASKSDPDGTRLFQKVVTGADEPTEGKIEENNAGNGGTVTALFRLQPADTDAIGTTKRHFDVQMLFSDGTLRTPFVGTILAAAGITTETS